MRCRDTCHTPTTAAQEWLPLAPGMPPKQPTHATGLTRAVAARRLGVGISTICRMEKAGDLHATVDEAGVHRFRAEEIELLAEKRGAPRPADEAMATARMRREQAAREAADEIEAEKYAEKIRLEQERAWRDSMREWDAELAAHARKREQP